MRTFWTLWCAVFFGWDAFAGTVYLVDGAYGWAVFNYAFAALMLVIYLYLRKQWAREDAARRDFEETITKYRSFPRR